MAEKPSLLFQVTESAQLREKTVAMNEALVIGSVRQHELTEAADSLNSLLQSEISERKQAQEALQKSKQQYDHLASSIPVGIFIMRSKPGGDFGLDYVSPRMAEMFNASVESMLATPQTLFQWIHPEDLDAFVNLTRE